MQVIAIMSLTVTGGKKYEKIFTFYPCIDALRKLVFRLLGGN